MRTTLMIIQLFKYEINLFLLNYLSELRIKINVILIESIHLLLFEQFLTEKKTLVFLQ